MKVKLFTHTDLDGIGCEIVGKLAYKDIDVEGHNYDTFDDRLIAFMNVNAEGIIESDNYDKIFITDITPRSEYVIDQVNEKIGYKLVLLDHHKTQMFMNKYEWAAIIPEKSDGTKTCGTSLFYEFCFGAKATDEYNYILDWFVELVRQYDTWDWTITNTVEAKHLNNLLEIYGPKRFCNKYIDTIENFNELFDYTTDMLLELHQDKINAYIKSKAKKIIPYQIDEYNVGIVFAEQFQSEMGNQLALQFPEYDIIAMINPNGGVSLRTVRTDLDLGQIAKKYGGGGHPAAAGFSVSNEHRKNFLNDVLGGKND